MTSLQVHMLKNIIEADEGKRMIHIVDIVSGPLKVQVDTHCGDIIEFKILVKDEYDIFQVYKDGDDYYRVHNGYALFNVTAGTPENNRRMLLSLDLDRNHPETDFYLWVIPSSQRERTISKTRKCPQIYFERDCIEICLKIKKHKEKIHLTDEEKNQKVYLHKGDTIELKWSSEHGTAYRVEEKKYCPTSGGLYTVGQTSDNISNRNSPKGEFSKTFNEFGMSFLFRLTGKNQIQDITVCVINDTYIIKHVEINDNNIPANIIWIEQHDWVIFEWKTKRKQTIVQIEPFHIDEYKQQSIERTNEGTDFFWPYEPTHRGYMYHQFDETGLYCYKTADDQIGTIIVEPRKIIHQIPIFSDRLIHEVTTKDFVQFNWKMEDSQEEPILITIDSNSSVVYAANNPTEIFNCSMHKCIKAEPFFRYHFHTCETFLLPIPKHGLYNFACSKSPENVLISIIVKKGSDIHCITYDDENILQQHTIKINYLDHVLFVPSSKTRASIIYQTDEYGNRLERERILFQPQQNSINYFMKQFSELGIYYFSTDIKNYDKQKRNQPSIYPLAIIVLPEIHFHKKDISKDNFDPETIITTNTNDFVIWRFQTSISHDVIQLRPNETFQDLISCHDRAIVGKNRLCLAVKCEYMPPAAYFFCNPDFERVYGSYQDRLISTIIIDPLFSEKSFIVTDKEFVPNILYIAKNETVSWILNKNKQNHRIYVKSNANEREIDEENFFNRNIANDNRNVHYLHTFNRSGQFTIRSNCFRNTATVIVCSDGTIPSRKPDIREYINTISEFDTQIHLDYSNRNSIIYYTLDGSIPTRRDNENIHVYDPHRGVRFLEPGLHILRAYLTEDGKISSSIRTSSPTFVMGNEASIPSWDHCQITLSISLDHQNKIHGKIKVEPTHAIDLIDHFQLFINDTAQKINESSKHVYLSADSFVPGEKYLIHVVAYPKDHIINAKPISSNRLPFEIQREIPGPPPIRPISPIPISPIPISPMPISPIPGPKEHQQPDIYVGVSMTGMKLDKGTKKPRQGLSNGFDYRLQILLDKLRHDIEIRSNISNST